MDDQVGNGTGGVEILTSSLDTKAMRIPLPQRKVHDLVERLQTWPPGRQAATARDVLVLLGIRYHAAFVIWPGRYFVGRLLQLRGLHLNEGEIGRWRRRVGEDKE